MSYFRTNENIQPTAPNDHLRFVTVKSPALKARADVTLYVPPQSAGQSDVPLLILLHGIYGSHWAWTMKGHAHLTAQRMIDAGELRPLVIAMPSDGLWDDGSGYVTHPHADFEKWIIEDVPHCAAEVVPAVNASNPFFLAGLSMGGYGALRLGAKYAERVRGISAHSSCTSLRDLAPFIEEPLAAYVDIAFSQEAEALYWLQRQRAQLPPVRFDCGTEDQLIEQNRALHTALLAQDIPHTYQEFPGAHSWEYWQEHLVDTLRFCERVMKQ